MPPAKELPLFAGFIRLSEARNIMFPGKKDEQFARRFSHTELPGPAQLNTTEAAIILGLLEHDIPALVGAHLLVPLGKPAANAPKYFAAVDVVACALSRDWLSQATRIISKFWAQNKGQKKLKSVSPNPVAA